MPVAGLLAQSGGQPVVGGALPGLALVAAMALCLLAVPFGLPGLWVALLGVAGLVLLGYAGWSALLVGVGAVLTAELLELAVMRRFGAAYGGSNRAFWGAVAGGFLGVFVGLPVPLVGPLLTAFLGTFLGALVVTLGETRSWTGSARVGWGMMLARATAVGLKIGVGVGLVAWAAFLVLA